MLKRAKSLAAREGVSLTLLIEEGLRLRLRKAAMFEAAGDDA